MKKQTIFILLATLTFHWSCGNTKPKVLGKKTIDLSTIDTITPESFKFNFAYRQTNASPVALQNHFFMQGAPNSKTAIISTCNAAGTNCVCEFYEGETLVETTTDSVNVIYDTTGNYLRCIMTDTAKVPDIDSVIVRNQNSTITSIAYGVETESTLTAQKIIGDDLDVNRLRSIYRYECVHTFLEKEGTSSASFDCSHQGSTCWNAPGASGDLCFLKSTFPYYLFSDTYTNNVGLKVADRLYGQGTDKICGKQIKEFDCATPNGALVPKFGIFSEQVGIFENAIQLTAAPEVAAATYGFAAKTSSITLSGTTYTVCPPGLERRIFYRTQTSNTVDPSLVRSNYPNGQVLTEVSSPAPSAAPASIKIQKIIGRLLPDNTVTGDCNGTTCVLPDTVLGNMIPEFGYSSASQIEFCVIPTAFLPN